MNNLAFYTVYLTEKEIVVFYLQIFNTQSCTFFKIAASGLFLFDILIKHILTEK